MIIKAATLHLLAKAQNLDTVQSSGHLRLLLNRNVVMFFDYYDSRITGGL
jgi:hypothetical protein